MSISDGQRVRALESNAAWASKSADNTLTGKQTLNRSGSGAQITDVQQKINDLDSGLATAQNDILSVQNDVATLQSLDTFIYVGSWNANTNSPTIADGDGGATYGVGAVYRVSVAGSQNLGSGSISFAVGDKVVYNNSNVWEKWDVSDEVVSVNGQTGVVSLDTDDVPEGTALYFTDSRARTAVVDDAITNGVVDKAPSQNAVFDALATKQATGNYITDLTGDVVANGPGSVGATIQPDVVTNSILSNMATQTIKGRTTAGTGDPEDLSAAQATAILNVMTGDSGSGGLKGLVPAQVSGDALKFLRGDASWQTISAASFESSANDAATGSNATLSSVTTSNVRLTNGSLASVDMIPAGSNAQKFILINATGAIITVNNETGGTAANRILTGTGANLTLAADANLWLTYDNTTQRWRVVGGSGSGGTIITANRAAVSDGGGAIVASTTTATEIGYVNGVTSSIQTQLNGKEPTITTLAVNKGGTGQTSTPANGDLLRGNGTNYANFSPGADNKVLMADSTDAAKIAYRSLPQLKNYVSNPAFESNTTTNWSLGTVGTLVNGLPTGSPTFGSGAAGTLSLAIISSGQLRDTYSLRLQDTAPTTQGNMFATAAMTIDKADQAKVLSIKFLYSVNTGASTSNFSGTSSNSLAVAAYDVTNSVWLPVTPAFGMIQSFGVGEYSGSFQTLSNTASIRLVVYNANATTGGIEVYFDDFFVGRLQTTNGAPITDFTAGETLTITGSTSGTFTPGTTTKNVIKHMRIGKFARVFVDLEQTTAGTNGVGNARIKLPAALVADTSDCGVYTGTDATVCRTFWLKGTASGNTNTTNGFQGSGYMYDSTTFCLAYLVGASSYAIWGSASIGLAAGATNIRAWIDVPILGWGSNTIMSSDSDNRVVALRANNASATVTGTYSDVTWNSTVNDTHAALSSATYTVPVSGYYDIAAQVTLSGTQALNGTAGVQLLKNGSTVQQNNVAYAGAVTANNSIPLSLEAVLCNAGDTLKIQVKSSATTPAIADATNGNYFTVVKRSGSQTIAANETVAASYYLSANFTSSTTIPINFASKIVDTHGAVTTSPTAWKFTAPVSGLYAVGGWFPNNGAFIGIYKNGTFYLNVFRNTGAYQHGGMPAFVNLNAGDFIDLRASGSITVSGAALAAGNETAYVSIQRIGI